jgi:polysaccharide deacetylase family protein (PEP-CTERM system associated)
MWKMGLYRDERCVWSGYQADRAGSEINRPDFRDLFGSWSQRHVFILGLIAEHYAELVKRIEKEGHELAVHGYHHLLFTEMTPERAFQELDSAKKRIEDVSGVRVFGHRAPAFSINSTTSWAFDVLAGCGFTYDSSVMPCKGPHYGWPEFGREITTVHTSEGNSIIEVPMSTRRFIGRDIPACGGSYLRLLPFSLTKRFFTSIAEENHPIVYIHPYELDTERYPDFYFRELNKSSLKTNISLRSNWLFRKSTAEKFRKLMKINGSEKLINIIREKEKTGDVGDMYLN